MNKLGSAITSLVGFIAGLSVVTLVWSWWPSDLFAAADESVPDRSDLFSGEPEASDADLPEARVPPEAGSDPFPVDAFGTGISPSVKERIDQRVIDKEEHIKLVSNRWDVPSDLIAAVIHRESGGDLGLVGDGGRSVGPGQIQKGAQDTVNRHFGTDLDRENWEHNLFLVGGYLRYLFDTMWTGWGWTFSARPLYLWYHATRGYLCGREGAESNGECAAKEARKRLRIAGMSDQIPESR